MLYIESIFADATSLCHVCRLRCLLPRAATLRCFVMPSDMPLLLLMLRRYAGALFKDVDRLTDHTVIQTYTIEFSRLSSSAS